ncbi:MAG: class GN sortase [Gammaproteobacteria bacterium]
MSAVRGWRVLAAGLALAAAWQLGAAGWIVAKAELAQHLLERAWQASDGGRLVVRPWPWADTWPAARLVFERPGRELVVLGGASGRNLAFGPAHVGHSPWPGASGDTIIAGHRDTHFDFLGELLPGDRFALERGGQQHVYRVLEAGVLHERDAGLLAAGGDTVWLVTCYPFDAIEPGTPWRYVVRAAPDAPPRRVL